eukprot:1347368-Amorphochlora_amoeboformis.AAC.2
MTYHTSVDTKTTVAHTTESYNRLKNSFMVKDSGSSDLETTKGIKLHIRLFHRPKVDVFAYEKG